MVYRAIKNSLLCLFTGLLNGQHIVVNPPNRIESTYAPSELITNVLEPQCADYEIIASIAAPNSFGYFEKGLSNFPLERGVVISTGNVNSLEDNNSSTTLTSSSDSGGYVIIDEILDTRIGINTLVFQSHASLFIITPQTNLFSLRYIFASEAYGQPGNIECFNGDSRFQDGFAIIIRGPGIVPDTYDHDNNPLTPEIAFLHGGKNIALLPDGITEAGMHSIHNNPFCSNPGNAALYVPIPLGSGPIPLNGMSVPLTASSPVIPGETYEVEIIITNRGDSNLDSALFLEAPPAKPIVQFGEVFVCIDEGGQPVPPFPVLDTGITDAAYSFNWFFEGNLLVGENSPSLNPNQAGNYTVEVIGPAGCSDFYDALVEISSAPFSVSYTVAGELFSNNQQLTASVSGQGNYVFALDGRGPQASPVFNNVTPGFHQLTVTDLNGCGSVSVEVYILDYPRFFTPNGDGFNDTWNIDLQAEGVTGSIFIFDRFGKLLKQLSTGAPGWDGTFNSRPLPSSDYWFLLKLNDGRQFKSHFSLKR